MSTQFELLKQEITDPLVRENFLRIEDFVLLNELLRSQWKHLTIEIKKAETELKIPHGLSFIPLDVIQTSLTGAGTVTWVYTKFDQTNLVLTTSGACKIRAFVGRADAI